MEKLVERDAEEKTLAQVYSECSPGRARLVTIGGPLASGKTALLESFAHDAVDADVTVLSATASSFERFQPLGVMDQLLRGQRSLPDCLDAEVRALTESIGDMGPCGEISAPVLDPLRRAFEHLTGPDRLAICIDDAHFMDVESLQYLLALTRRMGRIQPSIILTYCPEMGRDIVQRILMAEILRMPNCTQLDLQPLSVTGVAAVLEEYLNLETAERIAADCRVLSGGRPLLVRALAQDYIDGSSTSAPHRRPAAGQAFGSAVLSCLYRAEPVVLEIAQAMATLREFRSAAVVAGFCGMDPESVGRITESAGVGGLLSSELLGQACVREAVAASIPRQQRHAVRARVARLLHHEAAPARVTAEYLMGTEETISWAKQVLCDAADQAVAADDYAAAVSYLERAHRECTDERERTDTAVRLVDVMWRCNPAGVKGYVPDLVAAADRRELSAQQSIPVIRSLLWDGEVIQAARVMASVGADPQAPAGLAVVPSAEQLRRWLPLTYPGIAPTAELDGPAVAEPGFCALEDRATAALAAVLRGTDDQAAVAGAELILREALAAAASPAPSLAALVALIYSDKLDKASVWCDAILASTGETYGAVWKAMLTSVRAEVHYRRGDLVSAERQARAALELLPAQSWGAAIVIPLSLCIRTVTAMGNLDEAERHVRAPVPRAAFGTLGGVLYLAARGRFHLARGCPDAALQDLLAAGHLMKLWRADCPSAVSWRVDAAHAYLRKGLPAPARELLTEQLSLLPPSHLRTRGITYRALAATLRLDERPLVLLQAADLLTRSGDSLNLAYTHADLSHTHETLGDAGQARRHAHWAKVLVDQCAAVLQPEPPAAVSDEARTAPLGEAEPPGGRLSSAERRVAKLAARGSTNEQIARKLFITVSTVEQHLTRVYRKLGIRGRTQLASCLSELVP
ncbi:LuxR family transcriptional regulator [Frankia sp. Cj3]|uniref:helix-turn-helix transcriptional regulator n=1 Tax=Frankia sp. Cj3 TaxID=2880976 RepID=UPI001EF63C50|nr:LuxR family transcriptional regulator [Frankia sp. Cj3]